MTGARVRPFRWKVPQATLDDLHERLDRARLLPESAGRPPSALPQSLLAELVADWRGLDWRRRERWLDAHPQALVELDDVSVHVAHLRSERDDAPALLVLHGWPHTFALQLDFADLLPDFHVVVASLPGFAHSTPYAHGPQTDARMADTMHQVMLALGHQRFLTYGEDASADLSDLIAARHPDSVHGILVTHAHFPNAGERTALDDPEAAAFFAQQAARDAPDGAYAHVQATRPDTLAAALNDSPTGLLAWLVEKLAEWSDTAPGLVEQRIDRERILTEAMLYWVTQSIATSFRPYWEPQRDPESKPPVTVPAAVWVQRHEHGYPESVARSYYRDLRVFERLEEGGHFAVAEVPQTMARNARAFARRLGLLEG